MDNRINDIVDRLCGGPDAGERAGHHAPDPSDQAGSTAIQPPADGPRYHRGSVVMKVGNPVSCDWDELRDGLECCWHEVDGLTRWAGDRLAALSSGAAGDDVTEVPNSLADRACREFRWLTETTVAAVLAAVGRRYSGQAGTAESDAGPYLPADRPMPLLISPGSWCFSHHVFRGEGGKVNPVRTLAFSMLRHRDPVTVRLMGCKARPSQVAGLARIMRERLPTEELAIFPIDKAVMVRIAAWFPRGRGHPLFPRVRGGRPA